MSGFLLDTSMVIAIGRSKLGDLEERSEPVFASTLRLHMRLEMADRLEA